jgi:hypothetical protein
MTATVTADVTGYHTSPHGARGRVPQAATATAAGTFSSNVLAAAVVVSGAFIKKLLHNHSVNIK